MKFIKPEPKPLPHWAQVSEHIEEQFKMKNLIKADDAARTKFVSEKDNPDGSVTVELIVRPATVPVMQLPESIIRDRVIMEIQKVSYDVIVTKWKFSERLHEKIWDDIRGALGGEKS